jgi:hypothetical protein
MKLGTVALTLGLAMAPDQLFQAEMGSCLAQHIAGAHRSQLGRHRRLHGCEKLDLKEHARLEQLPE